METKAIQTPLAPQAIGPYSQAIKSGNLLFLSGQIPLKPESGHMTEGGIEEQTKQVLCNMQGILSSQNLTLGNIVKTTVFLTDMQDFAAFNTVYTHFFADWKPARSTVQVSRLPKEARIEIEAIAVFSL